MFYRQEIRKSVVIIALVALIGVGGSVAAGEEINEPSDEQKTEKARQRNWRMRLMAAMVGDGGFVVSSGGSGSYVGAQGGAGVGINFEYRYSPKMGFEMGAMALAADIGVRSGKHHNWPEVSMESYVPLTFGLNYHPLKNTDVFDLYVGPLVSSTFYSNIGVGTGWGGAGVESGVKIGLGANLGADLNLGKSRWSLNGGLKYIAFSGGGSSELDLDPLMVTFGVGFKF